MRVTKSISKKTGGSGGGGRSNVTLRDLVDTNLLEPCKDCIVVSYKGTSYTASLDDDGAIVYQGWCTPLAPAVLWQPSGKHASPLL